MPPSRTPNQPLEKQAPLLWVILHVGCFVVGLALAALTIPLPDGVALLARLGFSAVLVLGVSLVSLAAWRQSVVLRALRTVTGTPWRWVVLLAAVCAGVLVWIWLTGTQSADASTLSAMGTTFLAAALLWLALSVALHNLVKIFASTSPKAP